MTLDTGDGRVSPLEQLAEIPEERIWLQKQKSARTRRAYRLDVQHFMKTPNITMPAELRHADALPFATISKKSDTAKANDATARPSSP